MQTIKELITSIQKGQIDNRINIKGDFLMYDAMFESYARLEPKWEKEVSDFRRYGPSARRIVALPR